MNLNAALDYVRGSHDGVLATTRRNGRPQLSNITYDVTVDGVIRISTAAARAKYLNLSRDSWAALHVTRPDFHSYLVVDGTVELSEVAADPEDETVQELVDLYRSVLGEHPDWDDYRRAMVRDRRVVIRLTPESAYGMLPAR